MKKTFYSNGKLLITGEYLVLDGAKALALPTKFGQNLIVEPAQNKIIHWKSIDSDGTIWFEANIPFASIIRKEQLEAKENIKDKLIEILHEAFKLNSNFITESEGYSITTELTFPKFWGLGTSSTLINNIAQWLDINAFELQKRSFGGSGYDVACAKTDSAIVYQLINEKPVIETINFNPDFSDKIFFIYLNKKQNSRSAIANYYNKQGNLKKIIPVIDKITEEVIATNEPKTFALALKEHEIELSNLLETQTVQESIFPDFRGVVKSLGAWGGDFVLAISKENPTDYFKEKGFEIVVPYSEMIL